MIMVVIQGMYDDDGGGYIDGSYDDVNNHN